ncbi:MAG: response regulator [Bdellovibrionales bacterium]|nr:response regulator [Bdellovibrionales bacterium]
MADKKIILVVEDDSDTRLAITTMLTSLGYDSIDFGSAREALDGIKGKKVDLALLDIMMPNINGYELLGMLKKIPGYEELPCIMVTAKDQDSEILEGYSHGADYYITKPFSAKQLEYGIKIFLT